MKPDWKGVYPAVTTKFESDGSLDIDSCLKNTEVQINSGVKAIVLGGTLGEASTLSRSEKMTLTAETKSVCRNRVPVILNVAESCTREAISFVKEAATNGADGLMMLPPLKYKSDPRETVHYFNTIANSTDLEIMVYNNPVDYGIEVTMDMFDELSRTENITAVKESTRDLSNVTRMKNNFGDRFSILCGVDTLALESLVMGADGWVAGLVCAFPRETVVIYELAKAGRIEEAREIYRWFMPLLELDINSKLVQNIKLAEVATGLGTEYVREPRLTLVGQEREDVIGIIQAGIQNRPDLNKYEI